MELAIRDGEEVKEEHTFEVMTLRQYVKDMPAGVVLGILYGLAESSMRV